MKGQERILRNDNNGENEKMQYKHAFFEANRQMMLGNFDDASALYAACLGINKKSAASMYGLSNIFIAQGDLPGAITYARSAAELEPENIWYQMLLAKLYQKTGKNKKAVSVYNEITKRYPDRIDLLYEYILLLNSAGELKKSLKVIDRIEQKTGISEKLAFEKERIYLLLDEKEKALNEIIKLTEAFPNDPRYLGILAESYISNNKLDKAEETYQLLLEIDENNGLAHLSLADFYRITKDYDKSFEELKLAFKSYDVEIDMKVKMLASFFNYSDINEDLNEQAYTLLNIMLETHPGDPKAHTIYGDYLVRDGEYDQARKEFRIVTSTIKDKYIIWEQLLRLENNLSDDFKAMYSESSEALGYFPNQPELYLYNGLAAMQLNKPEDAIRSLSAGIDLVIDNDAMKLQFYYFLAESHRKAGSDKESDKAFEKVLELDPDNKPALNNYSYYLALRCDSLTKAEEMSKRCVELEPDNPTYLDTYAWVLYKLNKITLAKETIEKALYNGGNKNAVIIEHYGDILYKNGEEEQALEKWKKADSLGKGSDKLKDKISSGILAE